MDAIAARTDTTRALINYYFGGKEKLYMAVLEHVYAEIRQAEGRLDLDHLAPVDAIRRIVEFTFTYYLEHEGFVRLVVAENQARGRHFRKSKAMRTLNRPIIDRLARVIARGQADGPLPRRRRPGRGPHGRSPRSACSTSPTSTPSARSSSGRWAPRATCAGGARWSPT